MLAFELPWVFNRVFNSAPLTIACKFKFKLLLNIGLCARFTYHPKLRPSAYRSATEMVFTQEMQRVDREFHIPNDCDPLFSLKINGEVLWTWRKFEMDPTPIDVSCTSEWFGVNRSVLSLIHRVKCRNTESNWATHSKPPVWNEKDFTLSLLVITC